MGITSSRNKVEDESDIQSKVEDVFRYLLKLTLIRRRFEILTQLYLEFELLYLSEK